MRDDGGPAFPGYTMHDDGETVEVTKLSPGMTLRDYFAAKALPWALDNVDQSQPWKFSAAMTAYEIADAMLEARAQ